MNKKLYISNKMDFMSSKYILETRNKQEKLILLNIITFVNKNTQLLYYSL
jgi:hypothetical protein